MAKIPKNCEFFQPSGEFVIARLADKTFEIKYLVGKPKQTKTLYKKYVSHGVKKNVHVPGEVQECPSLPSG